MPGGRGGLGSTHWFEEVFGFPEGKYLETRGRFTFADGILSCPSTSFSSYVGPFDVVSVEDLRARLAKLAPLPDGEGLKFQNIVGDARNMHRDKANADAVFLAASQFNCLEMVGPDTRPQDGISRYAMDATQGPACALSCPGATAYRNYMCNDGVGQGTGKQIDCLSGVGELVQNSTRHYWTMRNGYSMPYENGSIAKLSKLITEDPTLADAIASLVQVGIHWDTEVRGGGHRVCQIFGSACPVAYAKSARSQDWQPFASCILDGLFAATLAASACLALQRQARVKVYLTAVGGGAFGNRSMWIVNAMEKALKAYADAPLDVFLVHFASLPRSTFAGLEHGRSKPAKAGGKAPSASDTVETIPATESTAGDAGPIKAKSDSLLSRLMTAFAALDTNGDGIIDRVEFESVLSKCDPSFFAEAVLEKIFTAADANGDGEIHYAEFSAWVCSEDSAAASQLLTTLGDACIEI